MRKLTLVVAALLLVTMGCAEDSEPTAQDGDTEELSLEISRGPDKLQGNVLRLPVEVTGIEIKAADGDTSGDTGHFHVFIDSEPVEEGETIPVEEGVVHSAENPIKVFGLTEGSHELTVVLGNGAHERIGDVSDSITIDVEGPTVDATAPATIEEGEDYVVSAEVEGFELVAADDSTSMETGHLHVIVDPEGVPEAGERIRSAEESKVYHSATSPITVKGLKAGTHTVYVVAGDGTHTAFDPAVMDKLTVTVG
jgi:hypothetical protein